VELGDIVRGAAVTLAGYLIGGIPWGIVVARAMGRPDPRTVGSGRTGGANVFRAAGSRAAIVAGVLDLLKGSAVVLLARLVGAGLIFEILAALAAILGHSRSPYIGFAGGRGVAPAFGSVVVMYPLLGVAALAVFLAVFLIGRYSSLASLSAPAAAGLMAIVLVVAAVLPPPYLLYAVGGTGLIWLFHWDNIVRLIRGQERRIGPPSGSA